MGFFIRFNRRIASLVVLASSALGCTQRSADGPAVSAPQERVRSEPSDTIITETDDAATIIAKAIKAQGGPDMHDRWKKGYVKLKTTEGFLGPAIRATVEDTFDYPNRIKRRVDAQMGKEGGSFICVISDGKAWMKPENKDTFPLPFTNNAPKESPLASFCAIPADIAAESTLSRLADEQFGDQSLAVVRVDSPKNGTVLLLVDKHTGLLAKTKKYAQMPWSDKPSYIESVRADYRSLQGGMIPMKLTAFQEGKKVLDVEILNVKFLDEVPAETFAKP
jgi:hypothetical protein